MIAKLVACLFLLISSTDAVVEFKHSKIYDEFDFKGQSTVTITDLCKGSCHIYASITPDSKKYAANILIQQPKGFTTLADIAAKVDANTGLKSFLEITNTASLSIVNGNAQNAADTPPEVYEAEGMIRLVSTIPSSITVMSARPFTLKGAPLNGNVPQGIIATMSGYDDMEYAQCPYLFYVINDGPFLGFTWHVNGPIISLEYDTHTYPYPPGELTATLGITNTYDLERSGWIGSPGFHGCAGKLPYRSSLYDFSTPFHAEIISKTETSFGVTIETNSDDAHAVKVTDSDTGVNYSIGKTAVGTYVSYIFVSAQNVTIDWKPDGVGNIHFLARYRGYESRFLHPLIMIGRTIVFLFLVFYTAETIVKFRRSKIYDEFDFKDEALVTVYDICAESCHIYASVTPDSKKFAANLLIQLPKGFESVADVAARVDPATGQKLFLEINSTSQLIIVNANAQMTAGPLILYVVRNNIISKPEVYEAEGMRRPVSTIPNSVTVMSARPFTLKGAPLDGYKPQGILATMSGYDDMEYAQCPYLYYVENDGKFPGFTWEVNGPIISLEYDSHTFPYPPGELTASIGITNKHQLERSGWISSPGYHGCPGQKPYRSSLYDFSSPFHAEIASKIPLSIGVEIVTNSDDAHPISITEQDSGAQYSIANTPNGTYVSYTFIRTQNVTLDWNPDGCGNTHFLARYRGFESRFLNGIV